LLRHFHFTITALTVDRGSSKQGRNLRNGLVGKEAFYDSATLNVTELFSMGHSTANVCLWRLHGCVLNYIHRSATDVAEIAKSTNLKGCPHTYGHVVYLCFRMALPVLVGNTGLPGEKSDLFSGRNICKILKIFNHTL
jgi:hypothetical protein